uniref:Uncharacterized protein n=1 Tax=Utricularia reniformis TaxID=192314 RepID=A0A1Y0B2J9_9LAMI|nr:hypothetical protein AEK19_MT1383 [Utricularia reniformis]ART31579.1 hypothetical protein AEK19_MT1383 [Utricularia reniformis]
MSPIGPFESKKEHFKESSSVIPLFSVKIKKSKSHSLGVQSVLAHRRVEEKKFQLQVSNQIRKFKSLYLQGKNLLKTLLTQASETDIERHKTALLLSLATEPFSNLRWNQIITILALLPFLGLTLVV